jgi:hypothetical protein
VAVNGQAEKNDAKPGDYLRLAREWKAGDRVELEFAMPAVLVRGAGSNEGLVAVQRGPLVLAFDARLNPALIATRVSPAAEPDGTVKLELDPAADPEHVTAHAFRGEGLVPASAAGSTETKRAPLVLTSFAEAGSTGSTVAVWFPSPERLTRGGGSPFLYGKESYSRQGNLAGSIADGDPSTWRVTFDQSRQREAWFAVEIDHPVKIDTVRYAHGHVYHDGGWWDTAGGKPRIQVKRTAAGAWEEVARLEAYPAATATDPKGLSDGREFSARFPAVEAVGIRVQGVPACGDDPNQSFASCAELQGFLESASKK